MKVLLVNGSPHKEGCTYTALTEVAKELNNEGIETEIFWIKNKPIGGCIACLKCIEAGKEKGIELPKQEQTTFTNFIMT